MLAFNLRPALQFAGTRRKEGRKEVKGEETDPEHEGKVHAKLVLAPNKFRIKGTLLIIQVQISAVGLSKNLNSQFCQFRQRTGRGEKLLFKGLNPPPLPTTT